MSTEAETCRPIGHPTASSFAEVDIVDEVGTEADTKPMEGLQLQNVKLLDEKDGRDFYVPEEKALIRKEEVDTNYGKVHVTLQGTEGKPAIITFHDIGQNHAAAFQSFLNCTEMAPILQYFTIYHVDAPGQQEGAVRFPETYQYPSIDELAEMICDVVAHFKLKSFVGLGIGAGASVLCRYGLKYPKLVDGLMLINCFSGKSGWVEWGYEKISSHQLKSKGMTQFTEDYLVWHHFGKRSTDENKDLVASYRKSLETCFNPFNLGLFVESFSRRSEINMRRPVHGETSNVPSLKCQVLLVAGDYSPHLDDVLLTNSHLDPAFSSLMEVADCGGTPLEEQPAKMAGAFRLFLQGLGYVPSLVPLKPQKPYDPRDNTGPIEV